MRKRKLLLSLLASILLLIGVAGVAIACTNEELGQGSVETGDEVGVYYYDNDGPEYLLSLTDKGTVSLIMGDKFAYGTYVREDKALTFLYSNDFESMKAQVNDDYSAISLTYNNVPMTFLRRITYRVSFDTDSGSEVAALDVLNGKTVVKPADPVREGYTFLGWYTDAEYNTPFMFGADTVSSAMTLYAQWGQRVFGENVYTIQFNVGDYEGAVNPQPKETIGGKIYNVETPAREGYTFVGWWYSVTGKANELTHRVDKDTVYTESTTLYAVWQGARAGDKLQAPVVDVADTRISWEPVSGAVEYRVQVSGPQGFTAVDRAVTTTNTEVAFNLAGSYTVEVTAISGASESNNSETTSRTYHYNPLARVSLFHIINSNVLLWNAVDNAEKYLITVDCGNEDHNHNPFDNGSSTNFNFSYCEMQEGGIRFTVTAIANGYASSVSDEFVYEKSLSAIPELRYDEATQTISWQSVPEAMGYTVTVTCGTEGHNHSAINVGGQTSYCIKECAVPEDGIEINVTPYTKGYNSPAATSYKVTAAQKSSPVTPNNLRIVGSTLSWSDVGAESYVVRIGDQEIETIETSLDLAAQDVSWTKGSDYSISVKAQVGAAASVWSDALDARYFAMSNSLTYNKNTVSWQYVIGAKGYEVRVNSGSVKNVTNGANSARVKLTKSGANKIEVRYYTDTETSAWASMTVNAYALTIDTRGGQIASTVNATQYYAPGDDIILPNGNEITKEGYTLGDMYNTPAGPEGNGLRFGETEFSSNGDMILYASWIPKTYKITLNYNNGGSGITEAYVTFGKPFTLPTPETITEGTTLFGGWCANSLGTAASYTDELGNSVANWSIAEDTEVYAKWLSVYKFEKNAGGSAGYYFTLLAGEVSKAVTNARIPATYKAPGDAVAYPVTQIGTNAFRSCIGVEVIELPSTIDTIQPRTFESYTSLREINVYKVDDVTNDTYWSDNGVLMFNNATAGTVEIWGVPRAMKGTYTISDRVTDIPTRTFYHIELDELRIPASVNYIADEAFYYCDTPKITFLSPAEGETSLTLRLEIGSFYYANKLETVTLPAREFVVWDSSKEQAIEIPDFNLEVFRNCSVLNDILVDEASDKYQSIDGMLCTKGADATLLYCPNNRTDTLTIPVGIVKIGRRAFSDCRKITKVIIPNWVEEIGEEAFGGYAQQLPGSTSKTTVYGCIALETLVFEGGDGVAADLIIGKNAFGNKNESILTICNKLDTIEFKEGSKVVSIGEYAFARCPIVSIILPASLAELKEGAFYGCASLETVEYAPDGRDMSVGDEVFANCTSFTTVKLPATITEFKDGVFSGCNNLSRVEVDPENPVLADIDGVLFTKDEKEILFFPFGKEGNYEIPETVERISGGAFAGKTNVTDVTIGKNVTYIGAGAFRNCTELTTITFEDGGTEELVIGTSAFNSCTSLTSFKLPARVKTLPDKMLYRAYLISEIEIPEGVEKIGFMSLSSVGSNSGASLAKLVIPSTVKEVGITALYNCGAREIEFKNKQAGTEDIVFKAAEEKINSKTSGKFWDDDYIIPTIEIGESKMFYLCDKLEKITLPYGLVVMPGGMFSSCSKLAEVNVPGSVKSLGAAVFSTCTSIVSITFDERDTDPDDPTKNVELVLENGTKDSGQYTSYKGVFSGCTKLASIELPEGVSRIPDYAFANCSALQSITIPASVKNGQFNAGTTQLTAIGTGAFENCKALETVTFTEGGTGDFSLGNYSFNGCTSLRSITLPARLADSHVVGGGKDRVAGGVRTGYQSTDTGYNTSCASFNGCSLLASVNVEEGGQHYASKDGILYSADFTEIVFVPNAYSTELTIPSSVELVRNFVFICNKRIKTVTFAERVATQADGDDEAPASHGLKIGEDNALTSAAGAFTGCTALEEVYLPAHLESFAPYSFYGCTKLRIMTFAEGTNGFTSIGHDAFNVATNGSKLSTIILPDSVETIGDRAFFQNTGLQVFTVSPNSKLTSIGEKAFYGTAIQEFYLPPARSLTIGLDAFSNCIKLTTVHLPNTVASFNGLFSGSFAISTLDIYTVNDEEGNPISGTLESKDGVIFVDGGQTLSYYPVGKTDKTYTIPVGVTKISASAFANNGYLEEIIIPNTVSAIGDKAFYMMSALKKVVFEADSVLHYVEIAEDEEYTGDRYSWNEESQQYENTPETGNFKLMPKASTLTMEGTSTGTSVALAGSTFAHSIALESVNFPKRLQNLQPFTFYYCKNLTTVTFDANCELGELLRGTFTSTALQYGGTREDIENDSTHPFEFPSNVTNISLGGSSSDVMPLGNVAEITIPANVTTISNYSFIGSPNLKKVVFECANPTLGTYLFQDCPQLASVTLPSEMTTISDYMFKNCTSLKTIVVPSSVTGIGSYAFQGCSQLKTITNDKTKEYDLYLSSTSKMAICAAAFAGTAIESAYIAGNVYSHLTYTTATYASIAAMFGYYQTTDPNGTTAGNIQVCKNLKTVDFSGVKTATSLATNIFMQLSALEEVKLPTASTFVTIGSYSFAYSGLRRITIPANVKTINIAAFACCPRLEYVKFAADSANELKITAGTSMLQTTWGNYSKLGAFAYSGTNNGRAEAEAAAQAAGTEMPKFEIDMSERKILTLTTWALNGIENLDVKLSTEMTAINTLAFEKAVIDKIEIPAKTTTIQIAAFALSSIREIKFAAAGTAVNIAAGTGSYGATSGDTDRKKNGAFAYNSALEKVDMSERKVTTIPNRTFFSCPNITEFKWSVSEEATADSPMTTFTTTIGNWAFEYSLKMDTLALPRGITSIGQATFWESAFKHVTIPNTLTTLGTSAFYQNEELLSAEFEDDSVITAFTKGSDGLSWTFGHCHNLASIKLPESLTEIGGNEYYRTGLTSISIPKSVTAIGNYAFGSCYDLASVTFEKGEDGNCSLATLGNGAFNSTGIKAISIPKSVTSIGTAAFRYSDSLAAVTFEKEDGECSLTTIGAGAFGNTAITSFEIPKSVTTLTENPFRYCEDLTALTVEEGNEKYISENNIIYNDDKSVLVVYAADPTAALELPESVTEIGPYAFLGSKWAGALNVTAEGFKVGASAFESSGITSVTLGNGAILGAYAFSECASLTSVTLGSSVNIGNYAFENCTELKVFTVPDRTTLGVTAFVGSGVDLTEDMLKEDTAVKYGDLDAYIDGTIVFTDVSTAVAALKAHSELEYVELAEGITTIDAYAFQSMTNLKKIVLPSSLTVINNYAFDGCTSLAEVVFKKNDDGETELTTIGSYAFQNTGIVSIEIPKSVTIIKSYAFNNSKKLTSVTFEEGNAITDFYTASGAATATSSTYTFSDCPLLETFEIPANLKIIPGYFLQNSAIKSIEIPASVTAIGNYAFKGSKLEEVTFAKDNDGNCALTAINTYAFQASALKSIAIPATVKTVGSNAFAQCSQLASMTFEKDSEGNTAITAMPAVNGSAIAAIEIPESATSIAASAFKDCTQLTAISIPKGVTTIGASAFQNCTSLTSVTFEKDENGDCAFQYMGNNAFDNSGITSISLPKTYTGCSSGTTAATNVFQNCTALQTVTFEKDADGNCALSKLGTYMFAGSGITAISLPASLGTMGTYVFQNCTALASVTFEKNAEGNGSLATIDDYSFQNCTSLTEITIPHFVTSVDVGAFMGCTQLSSVNWGKDASGNTALKVAIWKYTFSGCSSLKNLIIPMGADLKAEAFSGLGNDVTIYFITLPGPKSDWSAQKWLDGCSAKIVWHWSEDLGFLKLDGTFENAGN